MIKVSVIIPVYRVEAFIERCADSLFSQSLKEAEFVFVDDASPDNSIVLLERYLEKYPERKAQTRIIRHPENRGISVVRNTGLDAAQGEYIFYCDSDDWLESDALEILYQAAEAHAADIVYCDFFLSFEKNERYMSNPDYDKADEMLRKGFLGGRMKYNLWNKLVKRSLFTDSGIRFPEGHPIGEDMLLIRIAATAKTVTHVPKALYHYVKLNDNAYSNSYSQKSLEDIRYNADLTVEFLEERFGKEIEKDLALFKLSTKLPFLITDERRLYKVWSEWYPEANRYANANNEVPARTRFLQVMAAKSQWWYVRLYYRLVYKFIYGVVYR